MDETDIMLSWDKNKSRILSLIKKKVRKSQYVDDILQEVFIKYWEKNHEIKDKTKITQWLLSVARFTIIDSYRETTIVNKTKDTIYKHQQSNTLRENILSDESKKLLPIIYGLPLKYRNILLFSDIYELPHKVISKNLNLKITCVRTRVIRARKLLAEKMHECCSFTHDKYGNIVSCGEKPNYLEVLKNYKNNPNIATF